MSGQQTGQGTAVATGCTYGMRLIAFHQATRNATACKQPGPVHLTTTAHALKPSKHLSGSLVTAGQL